jgi:hypothetical protein
MAGNTKETIESHLTVVEFKARTLKDTVKLMRTYSRLSRKQAVFFMAELSQMKDQLSHVEKLLLEITEKK